MLEFGWDNTIMRSLCWRSALLAVALCSLPLATAHAARKPLVVSSIRPLHLIVRAVAGDAVETRTLGSVRGTGHDFVLRPSDLRLLRSADRIFWIGPALERPLGEMLRRLPQPERAVALREAVSADPASSADPHVWLDPRAAVQIAARMIAALEAQGQIERGSLAPSLAAFAAEMQATEAAMREEFAAVRATPFFVIHDGYGHLVHRFGLHQAGALSLDEEHTPGARTLAALRARLRDTDAACVLTEPGVNPSLLAALTEGSGARLLELDPMAYNSAEDAHSFARFLRVTGQRLTACLKPTSLESATHE